MKCLLFVLNTHQQETGLKTKVGFYCQVLATVCRSASDFQLWRSLECHQCW